MAENNRVEEEIKLRDLVSVIIKRKTAPYTNNIFLFIILCPFFPILLTIVNRSG